MSAILFTAFGILAVVVARVLFDAIKEGPAAIRAARRKSKP